MSIFKNYYKEKEIMKIEAREILVKDVFDEMKITIPMRMII